MTSLRKHLLWPIFIFTISIGVFLRVDQIRDQWLTDDEWHALHQVTSGKTYYELVSTAGIADFSIPQAIYYKYLTSTEDGITENKMRAPLLLCGTLTILIFSIWALFNFGHHTAISFSILISISPLLTTFSRTARPYAATLLLSWIALYFLQKLQEKSEERYALYYASLAVFACWLHMAAAPFVLAPGGWVLYQQLRSRQVKRNWRGARALLTATAAMATGIAILCLRPMWLSRPSLESRIGHDLPVLDTWIGVWHTWLGTDSKIAVSAGLILAAIGGANLIRKPNEILSLAAIGSIGLLASIYLTRPSWVQNALTFGRYMLPTQPLFLLCIAIGIQNLLRPALGTTIKSAGSIALPILFLAGTPYMDLLMRPNNFTLHSWYQFDYRKSQSPVRRYLTERPTHQFWTELAKHPPNSLRIAVAGLALESYNQHDVRWQRIHHQTVIKAQLSGYCHDSQLAGEALPSQGVKLNNAVTLSAPSDLAKKKLDYLVFDKKNGGHIRIEECIQRFQREHHPPQISDDQIAVFKLN